MWGWGMITPQMINQMMLLFRDDLAAYSGTGMSLQMVDLLCGLGSGGTLPNHCHRDLLLRMPGVLMPKLHPFDIPLVHQIAGKIFPSTHMILPHELFSCIYHYYPTAFFTYILPSTDILESFWDSVKGWCAPDQTPTAALEFIEVLQSADILQLKACSIRQQTATRLDNLIPAET